jgi:hypothetical protein
MDLSARYRDLYGVGDSTAIGFRRTNLAVFGGVSYPTLYYSGDISFDTALAAVAQGRVLQPFTFSGHISAFTNPSLTGPPVFDADLLGTGTAGAVTRRPIAWVFSQSATRSRPTTLSFPNHRRSFWSGRCWARQRCAGAIGGAITKSSCPVPRICPARKALLRS